MYTPNKPFIRKGDFTMIGNTNLTLVNYDDDENNGGNDMNMWMLIMILIHCKPIISNITAF
ncbi:MAG: hypothetical protein R2812_06665 [Gelidibacter sp.]